MDFCADRMITRIGCSTRIECMLVSNVRLSRVSSVRLSRVSSVRLSRVSRIKCLPGCMRVLLLYECIMYLTGDVKILVGSTFNDLVLDTTKNVFVEFYAPYVAYYYSYYQSYSRNTISCFYPHPSSSIHVFCAIRCVATVSH